MNRQSLQVLGFCLCVCPICVYTHVPKSSVDRLSVKQACTIARFLLFSLYVRIYFPGIYINIFIQTKKERFEEGADVLARRCRNGQNPNIAFWKSVLLGLIHGSPVFLRRRLSLLSKYLEMAIWADRVCSLPAWLTCSGIYKCRQGDIRVAFSPLCVPVGRRCPSKGNQKGDAGHPTQQTVPLPFFCVFSFFFFYKERKKPARG
jgi:hypothetical protein